MNEKLLISNNKGKIDILKLASELKLENTNIVMENLNNKMGKLTTLTKEDLPDSPDVQEGRFETAGQIPGPRKRK